MPKEEKSAATLIEPDKATILREHYAELGRKRWKNVSKEEHAKISRLGGKSCAKAVAARGGRRRKPGEAGTPPEAATPEGVIVKKKLKRGGGKKVAVKTKTKAKAVKKTTKKKS